jgi:hypothetical protein
MKLQMTVRNEQPATDLVVTGADVLQDSVCLRWLEVTPSLPSPSDGRGVVVRPGEALTVTFESKPTLAT